MFTNRFGTKMLKRVFQSCNPCHRKFSSSPPKRNSILGPALVAGAVVGGAGLIYKTKLEKASPLDSIKPIQDATVIFVLGGLTKA
jgi:hypothetical protein